MAKYTSNFLVGSASPDILPDTPSGVATKTALTKINEGAVAFDGTGDYLSLAASTDFNLLGDGTFTIEFFVYANSLNGSYADYVGVFDGANSGLLIYQNGSNLDVYINSGQRCTTTHPGTKKWSHIALTRDGTTLRLFVDGISKSTSTASLGSDYSGALQIGGASGRNDLDGFISNVRVIKGTALYTSNFTPPTEPLTNVTNTKLLCCHDPLSAVGSIVTPGNITANGDAQATTFNPFNTDVNTIRGQETRYCTMNPLSIGDGTPPTLSNGNLTVKANTTIFSRTNGDTYATSGKFYAEVTKVSGQTSDDSIGIGARTYQALQSTNPYIGRTSDSYGFYGSGSKIHNNTITGSYSDSWGQLGDVMGILMDLDNGEISLSINGIDQGVAYTGIDASLGWTFCVAPYNNQEYSLNFGQKPFKFTPPDGYQTLSGSSIRPEKVIPIGSKYHGALTYTGDGETSERTITGLNLDASPDLIWLKNRDAGGTHLLWDAVRGGSLCLSPDDTGQEYALNDWGYGCITGNTRNGIKVSGGSLSASHVNTDTEKYIAWCWRAGGNKNTFSIDDVGYASAAAAGLDGGSTNPTGASVNTKSKFGIYTFDGNSSNRTMSHGLGQQPDFMICKKKSASGNAWVIWHKSLTSTQYMMFTSDPRNSDATLFNSHASDSSTLWTLGSNTTFNENGQSSVAYLWCNVPGLQQFGEYTGNGSASGPYVELGFRPAIVIVKYANTSGSASWFMYDNARSTTNPNNKTIMSNLTTAEQSAYDMDFLSNGFRLKYADSSGYTNVSGASFIYMAWAEAPAFNMFGATSNAR